MHDSCLIICGPKGQVQKGIGLKNAARRLDVITPGQKVSDKS